MVEHTPEPACWGQAEDDAFIVGFAGWRAAVFSFFRYLPAYNTALAYPSLLPPAESRPQKARRKARSRASVDGSGSHLVAQDRPIFLRACASTLAHETLHMFEIQHCVYYSCMMQGSAGLEEDAKAPLRLCVVELRKLACVQGLGMTAGDETDDTLALSWATERYRLLHECVVRVCTGVCVK